MGRKVKTSDVLDENIRTLRAITAEVIGRYGPTGPNRWDDWELTSEGTGEQLEIGPGNTLQLEELGADPELRLRFRRGRGVVLRLRWLPTDEDLEALESGQWGVQEAEQATLIERLFKLGPENDPRDDMLEYFLERIAEPYSHDEGIGFEAMLVKKLRGR